MDDDPFLAAIKRALEGVFGQQQRLQTDMEAPNTSAIKALYNEGVKAALKQIRNADSQLDPFLLTMAQDDKTAWNADKSEYINALTKRYQELMSKREQLHPTALDFPPPTRTQLDRFIDTMTVITEGRHVDLYSENTHSVAGAHTRLIYYPSPRDLSGRRPKTSITDRVEVLRSINKMIADSPDSTPKEIQDAQQMMAACNTVTTFISGIEQHYTGAISEHKKFTQQNVRPENRDPTSGDPGTPHHHQPRIPKARRAPGNPRDR